MGELGQDHIAIFMQGKTIKDVTRDSAYGVNPPATRITFTDGTYVVLTPVHHRYRGAYDAWVESDSIDAMPFDADGIMAQIPVTVYRS